MVHRPDHQQRGDGTALGPKGAVAEHQEGRAGVDRRLGLVADALEGDAHAGGALGDGPGGVDDLRLPAVHRDVLDRLALLGGRGERRGATRLGNW